MKTALLSVWKENDSRARYPLLAAVLFVMAIAVLGTLRGDRTGFIPGFLSYPR